MSARSLPSDQSRMQIGKFQLDVVSGGRFRLDGGSMFGIIPKPLWERETPADDRNRIQLDTNCAVIRSGLEVVLVDTGNGTKLGDKEREIFALEGEDSLVRSLAGIGLRPEEITIVLYTHLHMDHAGGGTRPGPDAGIMPTFPNARYCVQRAEWEDALANRSHMRVSYRLENLAPLQESGRLELLDGSGEILRGLRVEVTGGHTRGHQSVFVESEGATALCFGDLVPTRAHLRGPYLMAYDLDPYGTLTRKMPLIESAAREGWTIVWDHDPELPIGRIAQREDGRFEGVAIA